jgi:hypothetical protein
MRKEGLNFLLPSTSPCPESERNQNCYYIIHSGLITYRNSLEIDLKITRQKEDEIISVRSNLLNINIMKKINFFYN